MSNLLRQQTRTMLPKTTIAQRRTEPHRSLVCGIVSRAFRDEAQGRDVDWGDIPFTEHANLPIPALKQVAKDLNEIARMEDCLVCEAGAGDDCRKQNGRRRDVLHNSRIPVKKGDDIQEIIDEYL